MYYTREALSALLLLLPSFHGTSIVGACPFAGDAGADATLPEDHPDVGAVGGARALRGMPCLRRDPAARERISGIVSRRAREAEEGRRSLQAGGCFTRQVYDDIRADIESIAAGLEEVTNGGSREKGHFFGGIVRLAAHDFMDYDQGDSAFPLGMDGCVDWNTEVGGTGRDNAGLETIWCDDGGLCPLKDLYDTVYAPDGVGRADFWVAAAQAVIKITSKPWTDTDNNLHNDLDLPFRYGRVDRDVCSPPTVNSALRLPGAQHCNEVEKTFITQMGLSWRDGVALLGAHTLGYGFAENSGHDGMWVDEQVETVVFDKRYYEEILRRAWRVRNANDASQDWTWAGNNGGNPRFMLNADICLAFDIDDSDSMDCCTRIRDRDGVIGEVFCVPPGSTTDGSELVSTIDECTTSESKRPEAFQAVMEFHVGLGGGASEDNDPFYEAFAEAWKKATEAGYAEGTLLPIANTCDPTFAPTSAPTFGPTSALTTSPTKSPTLDPTPACKDVDSFKDDRGRTKDCAWVVSSDKCGKYGAPFCPVSCKMCGCAPRGGSCTEHTDCCSNQCRGDLTCARPPVE